MKTTLALAALLLLAALAVPPASAAVDPCEEYGACVTVTDHGVFVGDCSKLTCAGVWSYGGRTCVGFSYQIPQCVSTD